jgi:hypothetical protein
VVSLLQLVQSLSGLRLGRETRPCSQYLYNRDELDQSAYSANFFVNKAVLIVQQDGTLAVLAIVWWSDDGAPKHGALVCAQHPRLLAASI